MVFELTSPDQTQRREVRSIALSQPDQRSPVPVPPTSQSRPLPDGGSVLPITRWGTPVMHHELAYVTVFDDDLLEMVEHTFTRACDVLGPARARHFLRRREADLYRHLESSGLDADLPRVRAVYAVFWRTHTAM